MRFFFSATLAAALTLAPQYHLFKIDPLGSVQLGSVQLGSVQLGFGQQASAQSPFYAFTGSSAVSDKPNFNLPIKTGGGIQVWTDHVWRDGYRIQNNTLTGHWRLIDSGDVRRAWGTLSQCKAELDRMHPAAKQESPKHYIVLLHGLMRTAGSMKALETKLNANEFPNVIRFAYASTRGSIGEHAKALREVLEQLPPDSTFSFVGHSMGNIVVRHTVGDMQRDQDPSRLLPRCKSMVMLGPPNQGAAIARRLAPTKVFGWVTGKGGLELGPEWEQFEQRLATPPFPFHIIAGDVETPVANPLVDGESDFVVSLEEAQLDGVTSFHQVPVLHSFLMDNEGAIEKTVALLKSSEL